MHFRALDIGVRLLSDPLGFWRQPPEVRVDLLAYAKHIDGLGPAQRQAAARPAPADPMVAAAKQRLHVANAKRCGASDAAVKFWHG